MGKTYSKKQKWTEFNIQYGVGRPVFGNYGYRSGEDRNGLCLADVNEKLTRHPNKKSKKSYKPISVVKLVDIVKSCNKG